MIYFAARLQLTAFGRHVRTLVHLGRYVFPIVPITGMVVFHFGVHNDRFVLLEVLGILTRSSGMVFCKKTKNIYIWRKVHLTNHRAVSFLPSLIRHGLNTTVSQT